MSSESYLLARAPLYRHVGEDATCAERYLDGERLKCVSLRKGAASMRMDISGLLLFIARGEVVYKSIPHLFAAAGKTWAALCGCLEGGLEGRDFPPAMVELWKGSTF